MATIAALLVELDVDAGKFNAALDGAQRNIRKFGDTVASIGGSLTKFLTVPLTALGGVSVKASGDLEALKLALKAVAGSAGAAEKQFQQLREVAKLPGLGLKEAVQGAVRLQAVGFSADQAKRALLAFGNAVALTGGGKGELSQITVQLGQLAAKGKVLSQDLRPIIEAAPAVAQALKKLFGTVDSADISAKLAAQGKSSKDFVEILVTELGKLPQVTSGLKNAFENLGDAAFIASAGFGDAINKSFGLEEKITNLGNSLISAAESFSKLSPAVQGSLLVFTGLVAAAGPVTFAIGSIIKIIPTLVLGLNGLKAAALTAGGAFSFLTAGIAVAIGLYIANKQAIDDLVTSTKNLGKATAANVLPEKLAAIQKQFEGVAAAAAKSGKSVNFELVLAQEAKRLEITKALTSAQQKLTDFQAKEGDLWSNLSRNLRTAKDEGDAYTATLKQLSGEVETLKAMESALGGLAENAKKAAAAAVALVPPAMALIAAKEAEIEAEEKIQKAATNTAVLSASNARLKALNDQLDVLNKIGTQNSLEVLTESLQKYYDVLGNPDASNSAVAEAAKRIKAGETEREVLQNLIDTRENLFNIEEPAKLTGKQGLQGIRSDPGAEVDPAKFFTPEALAKIRKVQDGIVAYRTELNLAATDTIDLSGAITTAITSMAEGIGSGIANAISGVQDFGSFFGVIIEQVAQFGKTLGGLLIAQGVAALAAKALIKNPWTAIIGGAALIAVSQIALSLFKNAPGGKAGANGFAAGGLVFGPTMGMVGEGSGTSRRNPEVIAPLDKLRGLIGGNQTVEFFLQGEMIRGVLRNYDKGADRRG